MNTSMNWPLSQIAVASKGKMLGNDVNIKEISTDTRQINSGDLFIAIKGDNHDGNQYLTVAKDKGAIALMTNVAALIPEKCSAVIIEDSRLAYADLASTWRDKFAIPIIGVTGSNGKTTTKEMIAAILRAQYQQHEVLATSGNLNNDIGVPATLLQLREQHQVAVVEMGMNHPGEIFALGKIAKPNIAVVTNAMRAHLEGMGSVHAIAKEKGQIYLTLQSDGIAVINLNSDFADYWQLVAKDFRQITFALNKDADISGSVEIRGFSTLLNVFDRLSNEKYSLNLKLPGVHNAINALAAIAACSPLAISSEAIKKAFDQLVSVKGRMQCQLGKNAAMIINDTYNANPDSFRAAIDVLSSVPGRKVLVMGDMGEVGDGSAQYHDEIGSYAKKHGIDYLFTLGEYSQLAAHNFGNGGKNFPNLAALVTQTEELLDAQTTVLVKGSRFMKMERVVDALLQTDKE